MNGIATYIYHKSQLNVGKYYLTLIPMGSYGFTWVNYVTSHHLAQGIVCRGNPAIFKWGPFCWQNFVIHPDIPPENKHIFWKLTISKGHFIISSFNHQFSGGMFVFSGVFGFAFLGDSFYFLILPGFPHHVGELISFLKRFVEGICVNKSKYIGTFDGEKNPAPVDM